MCLAVLVGAPCRLSAVVPDRRGVSYNVGGRVLVGGVWSMRRRKRACLCTPIVYVAVGVLYVVAGGCR